MRRGINPYAGDFETVYIEAGHPLGDLDMGINYLCDTPTWIVLFEPLTFFRPKAGYWTWPALNMMALAGALFLLIRELGPPGADGWAVAALMVLYPPISLSILFGRGGMVVLLLFVLALVCDEAATGCGAGYHARHRGANAGVSAWHAQGSDCAPQMASDGVWPALACSAAWRPSPFSEPPRSRVS